MLKAQPTIRSSISTKEFRSIWKCVWMQIAWERTIPSQQLVSFLTQVLALLIANKKDSQPLQLQVHTVKLLHSLLLLEILF